MKAVNNLSQPAKRPEGRSQTFIAGSWILFEETTSVAQICRMKRAFLTSAIIAIGIVLFVSCGSSGSGHATGGPPGGGPPMGPGGGGPGGGGAPESYAVLTLTPMKVTTHLDFPATMQGIQVIEIRPMIPGYIGTINVQEGSAVHKGQLLFTIKNPQYEQDVRSGEAAVASAQANLATAEQNVTKVRPLVEDTIISKYELTSAENIRKADQAVLAQAQAALENARVNLGYTIIRSPLDGVIGTIPYKIGALVSSTSADALTTLSDISQVYAYFSLDEKQLLQLLDNNNKGGIEAALSHTPGVTLVLADGTLYPLKGKLETASGMVTTNTGSTAFKAKFANPKGLIRSGASATVRIPRTYDSTLLVPQSATSQIQDQSLVYVVGDGNRIHPVVITVAPTDDGKYYIVTGGLAAGDRIVLNGISSLRDSLTINPASVGPDSVYGQLKAEQ